MSTILKLVASAGKILVALLQMEARQSPKINHLLPGAQTTSRLTTRSMMAQLIPATILAMSIIVDVTTLRAADDPAGKVEVNTNAVGCADFKISDVASPAKDRIEMTVKITEVLDKDRRPLFACVCNHGFYNFSVYPKDQYSAPERVWMTGQRSFISNFSVGHSLMKGRTSTVERVQFPFFRRADGTPYSHYYIVFGCRSGG